MKAAHGIPVVHGVEGGHLIHPHGRHLQYPRHLVHHADAGEAVLSLAQVEQRHDRGFLVLARVAAEHFLDELLVDVIELEGHGGIVLFGVAVLWS